MTTQIVYTKGKCGIVCLRLKQWKSGFSIRCDRKGKALVGRPFLIEFYVDDLKSFCEGCKEGSQKQP